MRLIVINCNHRMKLFVNISNKNICNYLNEIILNVIIYNYLECNQLQSSDVIISNVNICKCFE